MSPPGTVIVVTGASGFIGRHLVRALLAKNLRVRAVIRAQGRALGAHSGLEQCIINDLACAEWASILDGARAVIHLGAIAHRASPATPDEQRRIRLVNVDAVSALAAAAVASSVRRLVLVSSVGVLGVSSGELPFTEWSTPAPHDLYSRTKLDAEEAVKAAALETCIVRPPLVFGPDAPGNFGRMVTWIERGLPLPLGSVHNRRSLVSVWNLCDLLITCLDHPAATTRPLLVADNGVISTPELLRACAVHLGKRSRLFRCPVSLLRLLCAAAGRSAQFERLAGSLFVDTEQTRQRLGWEPPLSLAEGLARTFCTDSG